MKRRFEKLLGEQAEARNVRCPDETRWGQRLDGDFQRIARFSPIDMDWAGHRIDLSRVEPRDIGDG